MKILIIGGTRFIGRAVALRLIQEGHKVAVLNRGKTEIDFPPEVQRIRGNRDDLRASKADIVDFAPETVLHNIVIHDGHIVDLQELVQGIAKRIVLTSSMDVYKSYGILTGIESGPLITDVEGEEAFLRTELYPYRKGLSEDHPLYLYDKIPAEIATLGHKELEGTILRLPMVFGPRDWQYRFFDWVKPMGDARPAIVESDKVAAWRTSYAYVDNAAGALALACTKAEAAGQTYNVSDGIYSNRELVEKIGLELNWKGEYITRPLEELPDSFKPDFNAAQNLLFKDSKIRSELGHNPEIDFDEAVRRTVAWLREHPPEPIEEELVTYKQQDAALDRIRGERS